VSTAAAPAASVVADKEAVTVVVAAAVVSAAVTVIEASFAVVRSVAAAPAPAVVAADVVAAVAEVVVAAEVADIAVEAASFAVVRPASPLACAEAPICEDTLCWALPCPEPHPNNKKRATAEKKTALAIRLILQDSGDVETGLHSFIGP
jgi:hypothetical protein